MIYVALIPYSPSLPIFRDLVSAGAELDISGDVLQANLVEMDLPELAITGPAIVQEIRNAPVCSRSLRIPFDESE